jgi:hypothetical protein
MDYCSQWVPVTMYVGTPGVRRLVAKGRQTNHLK